jgi:FAD/FMN-containing dehydrogenase
MLSESGITQDGSRLFTRFFDPVDMIACFAADTPLKEVNQAAAEHGLRFPLVLDPERTLQQHFGAAEYAPASARFGACIDNVPGMNWQLPSGSRVRVGERVVKSSTGYDLTRFLLHAGDLYGKATDYVLRLRPLGGELCTGIFTGDSETLAATGDVLRVSAWNHWIDRIDQLTDESGRSWIEVEADCQPGEAPAFVDYFTGVAAACGAEFNEAPPSGSAGLPDFTIKSTPTRLAGLSAMCIEALGGQTRALLQNGLLLVNPQRPPHPQFLTEIRNAVEPLGGHIFGRLTPEREASSQEAAWIQYLEEEWGSL